MMFRLLIWFFILLWSCSGELPTSDADVSFDKALDSDTLHVTTLYGSTSYFVFRNEVIGFDVEMAGSLADFLGKPLRIHLARTKEQMIDWLTEGRVDLVAYDVYETRDLKRRFRFVAHQNDSHLVLVQLIGVNTVTAIPELKGKTVHVPDNSVQLQRLRSLKRELGGSIRIQIHPDTVSSDDLIEMVLKREIDYTLAFDKKACQYKEHNRRLDCRLQVGFPQRNGWVVRKGSAVLANAIENWVQMPETETFRSQLISKYVVTNPYFTSSRLRIPYGAISPYDELFKKYAQEINWDWRLLASIAFHESGFDSSQVSRKGASGLMQLMPRTAASFGLSEANILNPEENIDASVQYIKSLNLMFRRIEDTDERLRFILASYNSGPAHVFDAMALAEKHGKNPHVWYEHVEVFLDKKRYPEYFNDEVVKFGPFRATETIRYVRNTLTTFKKFKGEL
jgi:membrane-bound lytic murein transglycosylase F